MSHAPLSNDVTLSARDLVISILVQHHRRVLELGVDAPPLAFPLDPAEIARRVCRAGGSMHKSTAWSWCVRLEQAGLLCKRDDLFFLSSAQRDGVTSSTATVV